jgi:hypothetical protein
MAGRADFALTGAVYMLGVGLAALGHGKRPLTGGSKLSVRRSGVTWGTAGASGTRRRIA